jgi:hypothetical protein
MIQVHHFLLAFLLLNLACSKAKTTESKFVISLSSLTAGLTFSGGGYLEIKNTTSGEILSYDLLTSDTVQLPHGSWDFYFVGFEGPNEWEGPHKCGQTQVNLSLPEQTIDIEVTTAQCSTKPYSSMIALKTPAAVVGQWDTHTWDNATWGP